MRPGAFWSSLVEDEAGTGLTSHTSFYFTVAVLGGGAWYLWGDRLHGLVQLVTTSMPPAGPGTGFR